jgi:hypothetical protein
MSELLEGPVFMLVGLLTIIVIVFGVAISVVMVKLARVLDMMLDELANWDDDDDDDDELPQPPTDSGWMSKTVTTTTRRPTEPSMN